MFLKWKRKFAKIYWKIFKPRTLGTQLMIVSNNKILLVKHTYTSCYYLPGGGVESNETFEQAIKRELFEELKITMDNLKLFGIFQNTKQDKRDTIVVFLSKEIVEKDSIEIDLKEIRKAEFFDLNNLPEKLSPGTDRRIKEYLAGEYPKIGIW